MGCCRPREWHEESELVNVFDLSDVAAAFPEFTLTPPHPEPGGSKSVFRVSSREHADLVLKIYIQPLDPDESTGSDGLSPGQRERIIREIETIREIDHPNIVRIIDGPDIRQIGRNHFISYTEPRYPVMLEERLDAGVLAPADCERLAQDLLAAEAALEAIDRAHRDIKPSNIALDQDGSAVLLDFGSVLYLGSQRDRITEPGYLGPRTRMFSAPEQFTQDPEDTRTDLYQIGLTLYLAATGIHPFFEPGELARDVPDDELGERIQNGPDEARLMSAGAPIGLVRLVMRCLRPQPYRRYASVEQAVRSLAGE